MTYILSELSGNVLVVGGYGAGNVGDEAILRGLLRDASSSIDTLSIVTHNEEQTRRLHSDFVPESTTYRPIDASIINLTSALVQHDHIIIGGGGIFSRYMGPYAKKIPYYTLLAKMIRKSVHWTALGVYPSTPHHVLLPLKSVMNISESITVRDPISLTTLHDIPNVELVPDPAFFLEPNQESGRRILKQSGLDGGDQIVGIAAREVMNKTNNKRLTTALRETARKLINRGYKIIFTPFCTHPTERIEQDEIICQKLANEFPEAVMIQQDDPEKLLGLVSTLDGMITTRLHSMIFSLKAEIPFASVEYSSKVSSLLEYYDVSDRGVGLESVNSQTLVNKFENINQPKSNSPQ